MGRSGFRTFRYCSEKERSFRTWGNSCPRLFGVAVGIRGYRSRHNDFMYIYFRGLIVWETLQCVWSSGGSGAPVAHGPGRQRGAGQGLASPGSQKQPSPSGSSLPPYWPSGPGKTSAVGKPTPPSARIPLEDTGQGPATVPSASSQPGSTPPCYLPEADCQPMPAGRRYPLVRSPPPANQNLPPANPPPSLALKVPKITSPGASV